MMHGTKLCVWLMAGLMWLATTTAGAQNSNAVEVAASAVETNSAPEEVMRSVTLTLQPPRPGIWKDGIGEGFREDTLHAGFATGVGLGVKAFGRNRIHNFALSAAHLGWVFSDVVAEDKWYRGNWELVGELFGGVQFDPDTSYVVGLTPLLRYDFATGTRWIPFVEGGAGVSGTDIGKPDLGSRFEFHIVVGGGVHYFWRDDLAITVQYRGAHLSNAGTAEPNHGVNVNVLLAGLTWFF